MYLLTRLLDGNAHPWLFTLGRGEVLEVVVGLEVIRLECVRLTGNAELVVIKRSAFQDLGLNIIFGYLGSMRIEGKVNC